MPIYFEQHEPENLEDAIDIIVKHLTLSERLTVAQSEPHEWHHSVGRAMRNGWKLWGETAPLVRYFADRYSLTHADDMSGMILAGLVANLRHEDFDAEALAQRYRDHWAKME